MPLNHCAYMLDGHSNKEELCLKWQIFFVLQNVGKGIQSHRTVM